MQEATQYNPKDYSEFQLWCLGMSAINTQFNGQRHDLLKHDPDRRFDDVLRAWWDITDRKTYLETIEWLNKEGHRMPFNRIWGQTMVMTEIEKHHYREEVIKTDPHARHRDKIVNHYSGVLGSHGIAAWDLARIVLLARMAATSEYVTEDEAWQTIYQQAEHALKLFGNWYQFAHSYLIGRQFTMRNLDDEDGKRNTNITHNLLTNPSSPWILYPNFERDNVSDSAPTTAH